MPLKASALFLFFFSFYLSAQDVLTWPDVEGTHKPWTRWWWHGSAVDSAEILRHLELFADAGIGGVEITSIYGVRGQDENSIPYLSDKYIDILNFTAERAAHLGLGVDIPPGSGWRCGGLGLEKEYADARLVVNIDTVHVGEIYHKEFLKKPQALIAFSEDSKKRDLSSLIQDSEITWVPSSGAWTVFHVRQNWSGAKVKRPAPGGEGLSFNPYSIESTKRMLQPFSSAFEALQKEKIRCIFHDSFEYSGNWMSSFFDEFENRRGYDLRDYLPELIGSGDVEIIRRVKCDYRETISDLVLSHFILPLKEWSHERDWKLRNQSHGSPANLLDLYGSVDIPETEIFRFDHDPRVLKFASSAGHVMGKKLVSSESFTWLDEHFTVTLDTMKRSADLLFASGINHIFYHGTTYSPQDAEWPGWLFYASSQINPQNPMWRDMSAFNQYITRCQSLLQTSQSDNDVLIYWPVFDVWSNPDGLNQKLAVHHPQWITENSAGRVAEKIVNRGVSYDFVSDVQIELARVKNGEIEILESSWKTIIVPDCETMPLKTLQKLIELAEHGANIIFENDVPHNVPGLSMWQARSKMLSEMLTSLQFDSTKTCRVGKGRIVLLENFKDISNRINLDGEAFAQFKDVMWIRKKHESGFLYFVSNQGKNKIDGWVALSKDFKTATLFDPMSGAIGLAVKRSDSIYIQLEPGQSIFIKTSHSDFVAEPFPMWKTKGEPVLLSGDWTIEFVEGGPTLPKSFTSRELGSWTQNGEPETERFGGTARYSVQFDAPADAGHYLLDLGSVAESAHINLNGKDIGTLFSHPFSLEVELLPKNNSLEIYVTNLAANRIRDLDRRAVEWQIFHDINFVNIDYQPFDASNWPIRESGLLGPVSLTPVSKLEF